MLNLQVKHLGIRHDRMRQIVIFKRLLTNILPLFVCTGLKSFTINGPLLFKSSFMKKKTCVFVAVGSWVFVSVRS